MKKSKSKQIFSWMNPKLEVREAGKYGKGEKGMFAKRDIKKGEMLAVFGGYVMTLDKERKLSEKYRDTGTQISENLIIATGEKKEDTDYFNHSCDPNSGFNGQIFLVAIRDIKRGEEMTFDYAMVLYGNSPKKSYIMKCLCGSKKCRKTITENDWKIPELQKKYDSYFQYFLQEKINGKKKC